MFKKFMESWQENGPKAEKGEDRRSNKTRQNDVRQLNMFSDCVHHDIFSDCLPWHVLWLHSLLREETVRQPEGAMDISNIWEIRSIYNVSIILEIYSIYDHGWLINWLL